MYKKIFLLSVTIFMAGSLFSQTKASLERALRDERRAENSAKADVYIQNKTYVRDGVQATGTAVPKTKARNKGTCKCKAKHS